MVCRSTVRWLQSSLLGATNTAYCHLKSPSSPNLFPPTYPTSHTIHHLPIPIPELPNPDTQNLAANTGLPSNPTQSISHPTLTPPTHPVHLALSSRRSSVAEISLTITNRRGI
ncbi:hypothetical protein BDD12DRAFT_45318 [Trichophaea hybrida]|nr:hypothetical protein BDD12DRAFT_45318 [Trichophaea hybrida]